MTITWKWRWPVALMATGALAIGCGGDGGNDHPDAADGGDAGPDTGPDADLPTDPPEEVDLVVNEGFTSPTDAVVSNDGETIYFAAYTDEETDAILSVSSEGGDATVVHEGAPLQYATGLVLSHDGETLYIADAAGGDSADGVIYSMEIDGGEPEEVDTDGIFAPTSLGINSDGDLIVSARDSTTGAGGLYTVAADGGDTEAIDTGDSLVSPSGVYVDVEDDDTIYVVDHLAVGTNGKGVLFKIEGTDVTELASGLRLGTPAGVTLAAGGGVAIISARTAAGDGSLVTVDLDSGDISTTADEDAAEMMDPAGLRTAREAGVFAIADSEGNAIFSAR